MEGKKTIFYYYFRSRGKLLEHFIYDLDILKSLSFNENEDQWIWKSYTLKIFCLMTRTTILALQSMDFGKENIFVLSFSTGGKQNY